MARPLDSLFGWWKAFPFVIWTPLPPEQAAVRLEQSLVNYGRYRTGVGWLPLRGSVAMGRFVVIPLSPRFARQRPRIYGEIVKAPGSGSHIVGELSYETRDKAAGAVVPILLIGTFGSCGIGMLASIGPSPSTLVTAAACAGAPIVVSLAVLRALTVMTSTYFEKVRAHLRSVLDGVDVNAPTP